MSSLRSNLRSRSRLKSEINVVPYIDVMLVLLVIFMVTAPLSTPGLIELPSVGQAENVPTKPLEVQISVDGEVSLRLRAAGATLKKIERHSLIKEVQALVDHETPVVIAADGQVPYETIIKIMDELRTSGIQKLGLLVDQKTSGASRFKKK